MHSTPTDYMKEIAEQLDCGYRVFIHKTSKQLLFLPDDDALTMIDPEPWEEAFEELENNVTDYHEIEKWTSREAFEMMPAFTNQVTDHRIQSRLLDALGKNKPFRAFKWVIDNSGDWRQQWFDFKNKWQQDFVASQLHGLEPTEE